jgi:hypothetical protein
VKKLIIVALFLGLLSLVGCSKYSDDDIAANVRGEEITVGELRFLYPDDKLLDYLDGTIKAILVMQEVEKMNIDITEELQKIEEDKEYAISNFLSNDENNPMADNLNNFIKPQAEKLGMEVDNYYTEYYDKTQKMSVYVVAYINEKLGEPEFEDSTYTDRANQLLVDLVNEHKDEIEIFIK